jgi:hypothetical protein
MEHHHGLFLVLPALDNRECVKKKKKKKSRKEKRVAYIPSTYAKMTSGENRG